MIGKVVRLLVLIAAFCINVRVKAEPVWADAGKKVIQSKNLTVSLAEGSLIDSNDPQTLHLVSGKMLVTASKHLKVKSPFGSAVCELQCSAIFERTSQSFTIKDLAGDWRIERLGEKRDYAIHPGYQISLSEVTTKGYAAMDFPLSLPWKPTVQEWASLYPGKWSEFKPTLVKFRAEWKTAVTSISRLQFTAAERTIASSDAEQAKLSARKKARQQEDQRLRRLFLKKNYLSP